MVTSQKDENPMGKRQPATTAQGRENQLIALAYDVVEKKMLTGNATSQELVHFLKMGTEREMHERRKLEQEARLAEARVENLASGARMEVLYEEAMNAFRGYQPSAETEIE